MFRQTRQLSSPLSGVLRQSSLIPAACVTAVEDWRLLFRTSFGTTAQAARSAEPAEVVTEGLRELDDVAQRRVDFDQHPLPFNDVKEAFEGQTTGQLLRSLGVLSACQFRPLVRNADNLLKTSKKLFGSTLVNFGVRHTFFKQFCGGETPEDMRPTLDFLARNGVGSILDYAAEDDVNDEDGPASRKNEHSSVVARTYSYDTEETCEKHLKVFLASIRAAADAPGQGFTAIKLTALGNPLLLERISAGLVALRNLFTRFDENLDNVISREEFARVYSELFTESTPDRIEAIFKYLDKDNCGVVDYLSWHKAVRLQDVPAIIKYCKAPGPVYLSALTDEELNLLDNMMARLNKLGQAAAESNVKLMIDAEHTYFQPAIDHAAMQLQRSFNTERGLIYNTYQCYLKDSHGRLMLDMERARREGYVFAAKLVRGAYMYLEKDRAAERGYPSPIYDTLEETHANYNRSVQACIEAVAKDGFEVMIASHNKTSIERAVLLMDHFDLSPPSHQNVYFGQLLGMADPLTFVLGRHGYRAYKYVPFGRVDEVIPYLVRRAQENSDMLGGVGAELAMLKAELRRRFTALLKR